MTKKLNGEIRLYDFFAGCGGTSLGFKQAGIKQAMALDSDCQAAETYKLNFPHVPVINKKIEDVCFDEVSLHFIKNEIKLFCGCAPCQPFTKQNTNAGISSQKDARRGLLFHFAKIVHKFQPELIFIENVPGIQKVSLDCINPFNHFLNQLENDGYYYDYSVIASQDFGAAQIRKRLILVASKLSEIHIPKPRYGPKTKKPYKTVNDMISFLPPIKHGEEHHNKKQFPNHRASKLSSINLERIRHTNSKGRRNWPERLLPKCYTKTTDGVKHKGHTDCYTRLSWDEPAPGLTTRFISYSNGRFGHPDQDRAISIREAALLQGFPNKFVFTGSMNSMARQIGNAVAVPVAKSFGLHLKKHVTNHFREA